MSTPGLMPKTTTDVAAQQLMRSPQLPLYVQEFQSVLEAEREKRERFYEEMSDDQKVEFINGEVIVHSPVRLRHTAAGRRLLASLDAHVRGHNLGFVGYEKTLIALTRNDYEPDIVYFGVEKAQSFTPDQMKFPAPDFVVEILSSSIEAIDRGIKFEDYAAHGVTEYWIVDPDAQIIEQYVLEGNSYTLLAKVKTGSIESLAVPGFKIVVQDVFQEAELFSSQE